MDIWERTSGDSSAVFWRDGKAIEARQKIRRNDPC